MSDMALVAGGALTAAVLTLSLLMLLARRRRTHSFHGGEGADGLDTIGAWPPQAVRVMTLAERQAYDVLRRAMPRHIVLAQVPLARFISVPTLNSYAAWLTRAGRLSADLLVVDNASRPVTAIQIRDGDETDRAAKRRQRLTDVLQAAGVSVHVWDSDRLPTPEEALRLFHGDQTLIEEAEEADERGSGPIPVAQVEELLALGDDRDYGQDPVASTFFDEFDPGSPASRPAFAATAPLQVV
jgi:Protein of unknown function (DUF2726)